MGIYYIDNKYVSVENAVLPVSDIALLRGYGVFDFLRTYGGRPFLLKDHLLRLQRSAKLIGLACPWSLDTLCEIVIETLGRNNYEESNIRIVITGGDSPDSITPDEKPRLLVMVTELMPLPVNWYTEGAKVVTADITRYIPGAKSTNYIKAIVALKKAHRQGAIESLFVDKNDIVLEGTTTNLFLIQGDTLITPDTKGILPGITRKVVLRLAEGVFKVEQRPVGRKEVREAREIFLTASNKEIVPVVQVDNTVIGKGAPGDNTLKMMKLFRNYTESYARSGTSS